MTSASAAPLGPRTPGSSREIFVAFMRLGLQGFGGVLPMAQHALVEREQWLTKTSFAELLTVAQVLPGPSVVNLCIMLGDRYFGWRGAVAALTGILVAPFFIVMGLAALYVDFARLPVAVGAMHGMSAVAAGLVLGSALRLLPALRGHVLGRWMCAGIVALAFGTAAIGRWPLAWVVFGLGGLTVLASWWRLTRASSLG